MVRFMARVSARFAAFLIFCGLVLGGCAYNGSVNLTGTWKDPEFQRPLGKVLVIGFSGSDTERRIFEQAMVDELQAAGVRGEPGHRLLPMEEKLSKEAILDRVRGQGFGAVMITKVLRERTEKRTVTEIERYPRYFHPYYDRFGSPFYLHDSFYHGSWYHDYRYSYDQVYRTGYEVEITTLEITVYDLETERPVWSALSETTIAEAQERGEVMQRFARKVTDRMLEDRLI